MVEGSGYEIGRMPGSCCKGGGGMSKRGDDAVSEREREGWRG